jgi:hypothetical protein
MVVRKRAVHFEEQLGRVQIQLFENAVHQGPAVPLPASATRVTRRSKWNCPAISSTYGVTRSAVCCLPAPLSKLPRTMSFRMSARGKFRFRSPVIQAFDGGKP